MKTSILTSRATSTETIAKFAAMKEDWGSLLACQKQNFLINATGLNLDSDEKDRLMSFINDTTTAALCIDFNSYRLQKQDLNNMIEFTLSVVHESYPTLRSVTTQEYNRFLEDAEDELTK